VAAGGFSISTSRPASKAARTVSNRPAGGVQIATSFTSGIAS
jgi:hypothetical protein